MLTDYFVHCPHADCNWRGTLFPKGKQDARSAATPASRHLVFECPACKREWKARIVGDDAVALPLAEPAAV